MKVLRKYIGDRAFYKMVVALVIPLIIQQGITNFVNLLDNVMVGSLGTESISAVAIVNQLVSVYNLAIFGGLSGISIFGAQFFGKGDYDGLRNTFKLKLIFGAIASITAIVVLGSINEPLISMFLNDEDSSSAQALEETMCQAKAYLAIILAGLVPFMVTQSYSGTLRETGETVAPMIASVTAIAVNFIFNYLLIFGKLGFPRLGVQGAAIATVISRYVEMGYIVIYTHRRSRKYKFVQKAFKNVKIPAELIKKVAIMGAPLLANEVLWSLGMTMINQSYSTRGLYAVAAVNINSTAWMLFSVIMFAMGNAIAIIAGQRLGAGEIDLARDMVNKLIFMMLVMNTVIGGLLIICAKYIPLIYNVEQEVRDLTTSLLRIAGASLPIHSYVHAVYFTIRSGGKTVITFLFDSVYTWLVPVSLAFILCRFTDIPITGIYAAVQFIDVVKVVIGTLMLRSGFWANKVV